MNRIIEIAVLGLGGLSLFVVAFLGFAAITGAQLSELAVVGPLFAEEERLDVDEIDSATPALPEQVFTTESQVVEANLAMLSAYALEPPYTAEELQSLAVELKSAKIAYEKRLEALQDRDAALQEQEELMSHQFGVLEEIRAELERRDSAISLREAELARDEDSKGAGEESFARIAGLFKAGKPEDMVDRLVKYAPEEAAKILTNLDDKRATELLNAIDAKDWKDYADAYSQAKR